MSYFTVIIPTLNEEKFIPRLLKNLNLQTFKDFEVVVVDGQSEDKTASIVNNFPANYPLKAIQTDKRNVSYQRNLGAAESQAKVLIFFDADTQIPKNYLERMYHLFETNRPHFATTYMRIDSRKPSEQWFAFLSNLIFEISRILKTPSAYGAMQAIKRTTFEDIGGYDVETKFGEDSQMFQTAQDYNYKFLVAKSPRYIFSLRRLRAEGALDTMIQYLKLNLSIVLNGYHLPAVAYEMGGARYKNFKKSSYTRRFDAVFLRLKKTTRQQSASLKNFLDRLFLS